MVKVSVVVPMYNVQRYIENTLQSMRNQSLRDIQIILVDDGSTDRTIEICKQWQERDERIEIYVQDNDGAPGKARNTGLENATGEAVVFFDSDDMMEETMLESMYTLLKEEQLDLVICDFTEFDEEGHMLQEVHHNIPSGEQEAYLFFIKPFPCNKMYRRTFLTNNSLRFQQKVFGQDLGFFLSCIGFNPKVKFLPLSLMRYLVREDSITMNPKTKKKHIDILQVFQQVECELKRAGNYERYHTYFRERLLKTLTFKTEYFDFTKDQNYLNEIVSFLNKEDQEWYISNPFYLKQSPLRKLYLRLIFKHRNFAVLGYYKTWKSIVGLVPKG